MATAVPATSRSQGRARAMGTEVHVVLDGADERAVEECLARVARLERLWSRFLPDSELSRLGGGPTGEVAVVSDETAQLLERARWAWSRTEGRFDPTVGAALVALGYDRSFPEVRATVASAAADPGPAPGCGEIDVDVPSGVVSVPSGVAVDPGAIGKGLAADLVAVEAVGAGATRAMVSVGGDLRVAGDPAPEGWEIELDHHLAPPARLNLLGGAVATSTTLRRRWESTAGTVHHVIDPRTGRPTSGRAAACTVVASEAWWAEAVATALLVAWDEPGRDRVADSLLVDAGALVTLADGAQVALGPLGPSFSTAEELR